MSLHEDINFRLSRVHEDIADCVVATPSTQHGEAGKQSACQNGETNGLPRQCGEANSLTSIVNVTQAETSFAAFLVEPMPEPGE